MSLNQFVTVLMLSGELLSARLLKTQNMDSFLEDMREV